MPMWPALEAMVDTLAYDATVVGDAAVPTERAAAVTVPALCIASTASPAWLRGGAMAMAGALPQRRFRLLEGEFHSPRPDLVAQELTKLFLG